MSPVKDLYLDYEMPNANGGFSEGDNITGTLSFEVKKDTKVQSIFIKAKGEANVNWTESSGDDSESYHARERFFKVKVYITPENSKVTVIPKGIHRHKFMVTIPQTTNLPSSFKGHHGKIVYTLEAKITRSWRMDCNVKTEFKFFSRNISNINLLMAPQVGVVDKNVGLFSKGQVQMSATMERGVYAMGETVAVVANVNNSSSKEIKPKCTLKQVVVYRANGRTISSKKVLLRVSGDLIEPNTQKRVICSIQIPADMEPSIGNCQILSVEYFLKVYLGIKFTFDPELRFPLVIAPPGPIHRSGDGAVVHQSNGPFPFLPAPYPAGAGPVHLPQQTPLYPALPGQAAGPLPQQMYPFPGVYPYALPQAASTNTPYFQAPPPYTSIFPPHHMT